MNDVLEPRRVKDAETSSCPSTPELIPGAGPRPFFRHARDVSEHGDVILARIEEAEKAGALRGPGDVVNPLYLEPCFGNGSVLLALVARKWLQPGNSVALSDPDQHMTEIWFELSYAPAKLGQSVEAMRVEHDKKPREVYAHVRSLWNNRSYSPAKNLYLRTACHGGLWHENREGLMDSPLGKHKLRPPTVAQLEDLGATMTGLNANVDSMRPSEFLDMQDYYARRGSVLVVNAPRFRQAVSQGDRLSDDEHEEAVKECARWSKSGAFVVYININCEFIRTCVGEHWPTARLEKLTSKTTRGDSLLLVTSAVA